MTVGWIAERLGMGSRGYLNHLLYARGKPAASSHYQELIPSPVDRSFTRVTAPHQLRCGL
jgi:hypothetical protein